MDSERLNYFVQELQKWGKNQITEQQLVEVPELIRTTTEKWASISEDWALLDQQQQIADKGEIMRAELHYYLLMAKLHSYLNDSIEVQGQAVICKSPIAQIQTSVQLDEHVQDPTFGKPSLKMVSEVLDPFFSREPMKEASYKSLTKLNELLKKAIELVSNGMFDKNVFEPILVYCGVRLLDETTRVVLDMMSTEEQNDLEALIRIIKKRASRFQQPMEVEVQAVANSPMVPCNVSNISVGDQPGTSGQMSTDVSPKTSKIQKMQPPKTGVFCYYCGGAHWLQNCDGFRILHWQERMMQILSMPICCNCFRDNHNVSDCPGGKCRLCNDKHNSMICPRSPANRD